MLVPYKVEGGKLIPARPFRILKVVGGQPTAIVHFKLGLRDLNYMDGVGDLVLQLREMENESDNPFGATIVCSIAAIHPVAVSLVQDSGNDEWHLLAEARCVVYWPWQQEVRDDS